MSTRVCCFGELLLRMSPSLEGQWINSAQMPVYVGGAELNVARALSKWGVSVKYTSAIPNHYLSDEIISLLESEKVDYHNLISTGDRLGIYFLPQGKDLKNSGVIYDRAYSSFSFLQPNTIDWHAVLKGCTHFHFSAISPALNENVAFVCKEALVAAASMGLTISVDLNYRSKLWQYGKQPIEVMPSLMEHVHIVMGNVWSAASLLGTVVDPNIHDNATDKKYIAAAAQTATEIRLKYQQVQRVANTFRFSSEDGIRYFATLHDNQAEAVTQIFTTKTVIDQVGSGDCFMAALLYGIVHAFDPHKIISTAASAAFGKLQEKGDHTTQSMEAILSRF